MKNHEVIRNLPVEEFAEMLVKFEEVNVGDEGFNGEWVDFYEDYYTCPDGSRFCMDYDGALEYTIDWLNSESVTNGEILNNEKL